VGAEGRGPQQDGGDGKKRWWEDAPIIKYQLKGGESLREIAERYSIPLADLMAMNPGVDPDQKGGSINLPIPITPDARGGLLSILGGLHSRGLDGRTLLYGSLKTEAWEIIWNELSPVEQEIEMALFKTKDQADGAPFNHIHAYKWGFVQAWMERNQALIEDIANRYGVDPALVAGILASEILYDYDYADLISDFLGVGDGPGYSSAHSTTMLAAYAHYETSKSHLEVKLDLGITHPWDADPNAPAIGSDGYNQYMNTDAGAISAAAMVARYYTNAYVKNSTQGHNPQNLSTADMAVIWGAYRQGVPGVPPTPEGSGTGYGSIEDYQRAASGELGPNATLAHPVMKYTKEMFK
jgi:LysM repeat protein